VNVGGDGVFQIVDAVDTLLELGVSHDVLKNLPSLPSDVEALLIYGSQARGDAVPGSDLDLLALVTKSRPSTYAGDVNISELISARIGADIGTTRADRPQRTVLERAWSPR
jgi:predicted nucleotidyltransferase